MTVPNGPWCPYCGTYLGREYNKGDICLECWEKFEGLTTKEIIGEINKEHD